MTYPTLDEATDNIYPLVWEKTGDTYQYEMFVASPSLKTEKP